MLPLSFREWRFCRNTNCHEPHLISGYLDRFWARQWLEQFKSDPLLLGTLRSVLAQQPSSLQLFSTADQAVIEAIADLLSSGVLHIHTEPSSAIRVDQRDRQHVSGQSPKSSQPPPAKTPVAVTAKPKAGDVPTFPPNLHLAAQVASLLAAASRGNPFCET
jgi:hypothetical protein